jgi:hypothetical protein
MRHPPLPVVMRALGLGRYIFVAAALSLLGGCGTATGDFGEVRPTLISDVHDWTTPLDGAAKPSLASTFELTDDEGQLRDLSRPLVAPPYTSQQWYSVLAEIGLAKPQRQVVTRATYATQLLASRYHSPSARYAQLMDDIRNDITRLPDFFETAGRVLDMDAKRQKSLDFVSALSPAERKSAEARIGENASIVALVREKLLQRESSYRYALERLVVATPSPQAVQVERAIDRLQAQIARYQSPAPTWVREQNLATAR